MDWPLVLGGLAAIIPALLILLASYAPYDGHFRDNVLFLFFMGGLFAGMATALFETLLLLPRESLYVAAMVLFGFPLLEQLLKLLVLNRRKYQGERASIFYGGSFGLGFGVMAVLFKSQRDVPLLQYADPGQLLVAPGRALEFIALGLALLLAHFATGIVVGDGVRSRNLPRALGLAVLVVVPVQFFAFEFVEGLRRGLEQEGLVWLVLILAYAVPLAWWAHARLLPRALPPDAQRKRRRALLRQRRARAGRGN